MGQMAPVGGGGAARRGPLAMRLETLLYRDGLTFDEALETVRTNLACTESREALSEIAHSLPRRIQRRAPVDITGDELVAVTAGELSSPEVQLEGKDTAIRAQGLIIDLMGGSILRTESSCACALKTISRWRILPTPFTSIRSASIAGLRTFSPASASPSKPRAWDGRSS